MRHVRMTFLLLAVASVLCLSGIATPTAGEVSPNTFFWIGGQSDDWRNPANWLASPGSERAVPQTAEDGVIICPRGGGTCQANIEPPRGGVIELGSIEICAGCSLSIFNGTVRLVKTNHRPGLLVIEGNPFGIPGKLLLEDGGIIDLASAVQHEIGGQIQLRAASSRLVSTGERVTLGPWRLSENQLVYGHVIGLNNGAMIGIQSGTTLVNQITISGGMIIDAVNVSYVIRGVGAPPGDDAEAIAGLPDGSPSQGPIPRSVSEQDPAE